ncbi:MAG TPA: lytic transglycosylase domain-containing protein [Stellaceae bacterium]|nr:lytic transglycosylase domain-containing protein [Stellaceae bacterium]
MAVDQKPLAVAGHALPPEVLSSIRDASRRTGVDFKFLVAQAALESGFRTEAAAGRSSASGLYQFTSQTWLGLMRQHGAKYGQAELAAKIAQQPGGRYKVEDKAAEREMLALRSDSKLASLMAAEVTKSNSQQLQHALGRKPNAAELRLAMFLGPAGAIKFMRAHAADAGAAAADLVPAAAKQNPQIFYDAGRTPATVAAVYSRIEASLKTPLKQVAAIERQAPEPVPLKPGPGLLASLSPRRA